MFIKSILSSPPKKLLFVLFGLITSLTIHSQALLSKIDSLKKRLPQTQNQADRFQTLKNLGEAYWEYKPDSAIVFFKMGQTEAAYLKNNDWYFEFLTEEGCSNQYYKSESVRALEIFLKSISLAEEMKDEKKICRCNFLISAAHLKNESWSDAEKYLKKTIACKKKLNDWSLYFTSLKNLGVYHLERGEFEIAETVLKQAQNEIKAFPKDRYNWILIDVKLIETLYQLNKIQEAIALNNDLEKYGFDNSGVEPNALAQHYLTMARVSNYESNWKNYSNGLKYAEKAIAIDSNVLSDKTIIPRANINKADALFKMGQYTEGYALMRRSYEELNIIKDARANYILREKTSKLQAQHDLEKLQKANAKLKEDQQNRLWWFILGIISVVLLVSYIRALSKNSRRNRRHNALLQDSYEEITAQKSRLVEQKKELEELNRVKDKLFSILSHDLRSPIGALKSTLGLLNDDIIKPEDFKRIAVKLEQDVDNTFNLLEELLEWSYAQIKGVEPKKAILDLEELISEKIELFKDKMASKNITFSLLSDEEINVFADKNQLGIVVSNLLSNAVKFTPKGGKISIASKELADNIEVKIKDSGIGIPPENIKNLFNSQSDLRRKGTAGEQSTGLGLKLCKDMIEKNNGTISVESEEGKGTVFTILIPKN